MKNKDIYIDKSIILEDDDTEFGLDELNDILKECGIKSITTEQALYEDTQLTKKLDILERQTTELLDIVSDNASHEELERYCEIAKELFNSYSPTTRKHENNNIIFEIYHILEAIYSYFAEILED